MKNNEWFKIKFYPHIGEQITFSDKKRICSYVKNRTKIETHSFIPFIHKQIISRKLRKEYDIDGNILNKGKRVLQKSKKRDIYYSNHLDANIFSYYSHLLNKKYDVKLKENSLNEVVTAYRKVPLYQDGKIIRNKCNIDFANEVFEFIKKEHSKKLVAIAFDIKGFFDNLDHKLLKKSWAKLLNKTHLDKDHYNIFKNITKFSFVEETHLFNLFQNEIYVKSKSGVVKRKRVDKIKYMFNQGAIAYCDRKEIHKIRAKGLIRNNKRVKGKIRDFGICQGSPISSVLANLYMYEFDKKINQETIHKEGLYRRYSDDMVVVCKKEDKDYFIKLMETSIQNITKLKIQSKKTQIFHFYTKNNKLVCAQEFNGALNSNSENRNFEYLGFSFNGEIVSLKTSSLAKYYRKMKLNVRRGVYYTSSINNKSNGQLFKRRIYKRFTYIGAKRMKKYKRVFGTTNKWKTSHSFNWGNFITYANLASNTIKNSNIKGQIKKHWKNVNNEIKKSS